MENNCFRDFQRSIAFKQILTIFVVSADCNRTDNRLKLILSQNFVKISAFSCFILDFSVSWDTVIPSPEVSSEPSSQKNHRQKIRRISETRNSFVKIFSCECPSMFQKQQRLSIDRKMTNFILINQINILVNTMIESKKQIAFN